MAGAGELLLARMTWEQVMVSRGTAIPVMLATGRPYGMWRDLAFRRLAPRRPAARAAVDVAAFVGFQVPVYAAILWLAGATGAQMATALATATVAMVALSRPYGLWLDWLRRLAGIVEPVRG